MIEISERARVLLDPDDVELFQMCLDEAIDLLRLTMSVEWQPPSVDRAQLLKAAVLLRQAAVAIKKVPSEYTCSWDQDWWDEFKTHVEETSRAFYEEADAICIRRSGGGGRGRRKGRDPHRGVKQNAAYYAYRLMIDCSSKKPTNTVTGVFFQLASLLYEAVTNRPYVELTRQCRTILASQKQTAEK